MCDRGNIVVATVSKVVLFVIIQFLIFVFRMLLVAFVFHFHIFLNLLYYWRSLLLNARDAFVELSSRLNIGDAHVIVIAVLRFGLGKLKTFENVVDWLVT